VAAAAYTAKTAGLVYEQRKRGGGEGELRRMTDDCSFRKNLWRGSRRLTVNLRGRLKIYKLSSKNIIELSETRVHKGLNRITTRFIRNLRISYIESSNLDKLSY